MTDVLPRGFMLIAKSVAASIAGTHARARRARGWRTGTLDLAALANYCIAVNTLRLDRTSATISVHLEAERLGSDELALSPNSSPKP